MGRKINLLKAMENKESNNEERDGICVEKGRGGTRERSETGVE